MHLKNKEFVDIFSFFEPFFTILSSYVVWWW